jgi:decaprenylphospho-beta-D-erythro-pentofuranosid-2-ulose 2-reductase
VSILGPQRVLLLGGSSEIGLAIVRRLGAEAPVEAHLLGRDPDRLEAAAAGLSRSGVSVGCTQRFDAVEIGGHDALIENAFRRAHSFDFVILAVGILGAQSGLDADPAQAAEVMSVDFAASGSLLLTALRALRAQGHGTMIVMSSAAVERPRASNAVYGAAKTGLDALAQALADATSADRIRVLVVRPGFVTTRMTAGLEPAPFSTTPEAVAEATVRALPGRAHTIWVPGVLRYIFAVLRHLPRPIYRRLPL